MLPPPLISGSLTKSVEERPKYDVLVTHPFILNIEKQEVNVAGWYRDVVDKAEALSS